MENIEYCLNYLVNQANSNREQAQFTRIASNHAFQNTQIEPDLQSKNLLALPTGNDDAFDA